MLVNEQFHKMLIYLFNMRKTAKHVIMLNMHMKTCHVQSLFMVTHTFTKQIIIIIEIVHKVHK